MLDVAAKTIAVCCDASPYLAVIPLFALFVRSKSFKQRVKIAALAINSLLNVACAAVLKDAIHQPRPHSNEDGMPSAHAMFWSGFLAFFVAEFGILNEYKLSFGVTAALTMSVCYQRVASGHHSLDQVIFGVICGLLHGSVGALVMRAGLYAVIVIMVNVYDYAGAAIRHRWFEKL